MSTWQALLSPAAWQAPLAPSEPGCDGDIGVPNLIPPWGVPLLYRLLRGWLSMTWDLPRRGGTCPACLPATMGSTGLGTRGQQRGPFTMTLQGWGTEKLAGGNRRAGGRAGWAQGTHKQGAAQDSLRWQIPRALWCCGGWSSWEAPGLPRTSRTRTDTASPHFPRS